MKAALEVINQMHRDSVIGRYAIGGAVEATLHLEPVSCNLRRAESWTRAVWIASSSGTDCRKNGTSLETSSFGKGAHGPARGMTSSVGMPRLDVRERHGTPTR